MPDAILDSLHSLSRRTRRELRRAAKRHPRDWWSLAGVVESLFDLGESIISRIFRDGQLKAWTSAVRSIFQKLSLAPSIFNRPPGEPPRLWVPSPFEPTPPYRLTAIEKSVEYLHNLRAVTPEQFAQVASDARATAITVARTVKENAVENFRNVMERAVAEGKTFGKTRPELADALEGSGYSDAQLETLYRTYYGRAQAVGQQNALSDPMVSDQFPYMMYSATHDSRVRPDHLALETMGLDGTAVYRTDDPFWSIFYPPWDWGCRCVAVPLSIRDAASYGVREASEWLRLGVAPRVPEFVTLPSFRPSPGWEPIGGRIVPASFN